MKEVVARLCLLYYVSAYKYTCNHTPQTTPTYCSGGVEKGVSDNLLLSSSSIVTIKVIKICNDTSHTCIVYHIAKNFRGLKFRE